jgi:hypothetical protein
MKITILLFTNFNLLMHIRSVYKQRVNGHPVVQKFDFLSLSNSTNKVPFLLGSNILNPPYMALYVLDMILYLLF